MSYFQCPSLEGARLLGHGYQAGKQSLADVPPDFIVLPLIPLNYGLHYD